MTSWLSSTRFRARGRPGPGPRPRARAHGGALRGVGGVLRLRAPPLPEETPPGGRLPRHHQPRLDLGRGRGGGGRGLPARRPLDAALGGSGGAPPAPGGVDAGAGGGGAVRLERPLPGPGRRLRADRRQAHRHAVEPPRPRPGGPGREGRRHDDQPAPPAGGPAGPPHPHEQGRDPLLRPAGDAREAGRDPGDLGRGVVRAEGDDRRDAGPHSGTPSTTTRSPAPSSAGSATTACAAS